MTVPVKLIEKCSSKRDSQLRFVRRHFLARMPFVCIKIQIGCPSIQGKKMVMSSYNK